MESTITTANQVSSASPITKPSFVLPALLRLMLLVTPEVTVIRLLKHNPLVCLLVCLGVFAIWLSVDAWPFRPAATPQGKVEKQAVSAPAASYPGNFVKAQWWSLLFCRAVLLTAMIHAKSMI